MRKLSAVLIALVAPVALIAADAPAQADTNWPCHICLHVHR